MESGVMRALVENHERFLAFLERRVGSRQTAEDILQEGFARVLARGAALPHEESSVAWFYRVLRNAVVDHYRRRGAEDRALAWMAGSSDTAAPAVDSELHDAVCRCVTDLLGTLKPEYAAALRRVELEGAAVADYAREAGITPNNAGVRLHRAREALRRQVVRSCGTCVTHACLTGDCSCGR
jgi:RNA polymerase sigma-70 factor (ECF subfamily)